MTPTPKPTAEQIAAAESFIRSPRGEQQCEHGFWFPWNCPWCTAAWLATREAAARAEGAARERERCAEVCGRLAARARHAADAEWDARNLGHAKDGGAEHCDSQYDAFIEAAAAIRTLPEQEGTP